jgi:hypothetical protein
MSGRFGFDSGIERPLSVTLQYGRCWPNGVSRSGKKGRMTHSPPRLPPLRVHDDSRNQITDNGAVS